MENAGVSGPETDVSKKGRLGKSTGRKRSCATITAMRFRWGLAVLWVGVLCVFSPVFGQSSGADGAKRLVLIDQDGSGPGGSNQMAMLAMLEARNVRVLGITMVTGNAWREEEVAHTLRMLELTGHSDVPVARGAVFPLVRTEDETRLEAPVMGGVSWLGAWGGGPTTLLAGSEDGKHVVGAKAANSVILPPAHGPFVVPAMAEGTPTLRPIDEDGVHFMIREVHEHPHEVTIFAGGPLTDIALAVRIDPEFAGLTKGLVVMGGSLNPQTDDPEFAESPRHEFNFWFDPEAAHIALGAEWPRIDVTTVDVSIQVMFTEAMLKQIAQAQTPAARYIAAWSAERYYMWDELAACAWLDPTLITREKFVRMDVEMDHGPEYGNTLTWSEALKPKTAERRVHAQLGVDVERFDRMFVGLMAGW